MRLKEIRLQKGLSQKKLLMSLAALQMYIHVMKRETANLLLKF